MKTTTFNLKAAVEERTGAEICPAFFEKAERYARRKLDFINERAGRTCNTGANKGFESLFR